MAYGLHAPALVQNDLACVAFDHCVQHESQPSRGGGMEHSPKHFCWPIGEQGAGMVGPVFVSDECLDGWWHEGGEKRTQVMS